MVFLSTRGVPMQVRTSVQRPRVEGSFSATLTIGHIIIRGAFIEESIKSRKAELQGDRVKIDDGYNSIVVTVDKLARAMRLSGDELKVLLKPSLDIACIEEMVYINNFYTNYNRTLFNSDFFFDGLGPIRDETIKYRKQIASKLIQNKLFNTIAYHFKHFGFNSEEKKRMVNLLIDKGLRSEISDNIRDLADSPEEKLRIAKLLIEKGEYRGVVQSIYGFCHYIDEAQTIADMLIEKGAGDIIPWYIGKFEYRDEEKPLLAKRLIEAGAGESLAENISDFTLDIGLQLEIAVQLIKHGEYKALSKKVKSFPGNVLEVSLRTLFPLSSFFIEVIKIMNDRKKEIECIEDKIKRNEKEYIFKKLTKWLFYVAGKISSSEHSSILLSDAAEVSLKKIFDFRNPKMRYVLTDCLVENLIRAEDLSCYEYFVNNVSLMYLPSVFLLKLFRDGVDKDFLKEISRKINSRVDRRRFFMPKDRKALLLSCFQNIIQAIDLSPEVKKDILGGIFSASLEDSIYKMKMVNSIFSFACEDMLTQRNIRELGFENIFFNAFRKILPIDDIADFSDKYFNTIGRRRDPTALIRYMASLNKLQNEEQASLKEIFLIYVKSILEGEDSFLKWRYLVYSPHIDRMIDLFNDQFIIWQQKDSFFLTDFAVSGNELALDIKEFLVDKIITHKHLDPVLYPFIHDYLLGKEEAKSELYALPENRALMVQKKCIELLEKYSIEIVKELDALLEEDIELKNDLKLILVEPQSRTEGDLVVVFTDDYWDLLLCGTDVLGSCQRVDGDPNFNKCLLGYVMDGKNSLVAVKDSSGKILARRILRFLFDEDGLPVLFMERVYPDRSEYSDVLLKMAKRKAKALGVPLLSLDGPEPHGKTVYSLGSIAPLEYVDSGDGITKGEYSITGAKEVIKIS